MSLTKNFWSRPSLICVVILSTFKMELYSMLRVLFCGDLSWDLKWKIQMMKLQHEGFTSHLHTLITPCIQFSGDLITLSPTSPRSPKLPAHDRTSSKPKGFPCLDVTKSHHPPNPVKIISSNNWRQLIAGRRYWPGDIGSWKPRRNKDAGLRPPFRPRTSRTTSHILIQ